MIKNFTIYHYIDIDKQTGFTRERFDLAVSLGLIQRKEYYDFAEVYLVKCLDNYFSLKEKMIKDKSAYSRDKVVKVINELKDIVDKAASFTIRYFDSWTYTNLLQAFLFLEARKRSYTSEDYNKSTWSWNDLEIDEYNEEDFEQDEILPNGY